IIGLAGGANPGATRFPTLLSGSFAAGSFTNYADASGNMLLTFKPVPPPPPLIQSVSAAAGQVILTFTTATNRAYILQSATNLPTSTWLNLSTNFAPGSVL